MKHLRLALPVLLSVALAACQSTTVLTEEDKMVPEENMDSSEEMMMMDTSAMEVDHDQSYIAFTGKSNIVNHEGKFNVYDVIITPDASDTSDFTKATVDVSIETESLETDSEGLRGHMMKPEFFDLENYPTITFESSSIEAKGDDMYEINGALTIKDKTMDVTLDAVVTDSYMMIDYDLPRKEFNVGNDSYGDKLLEEDVPVEAKLVFMQ